MATTYYRTIVYDSPPTPLGLLGRSFSIEHRCLKCRAAVATPDLVAHAKAHGDDHEDRCGQDNA
jgi:hypothetical protein